MGGGSLLPHEMQWVASLGLVSPQLVQVGEMFDWSKSGSIFSGVACGVGICVCDDSDGLFSTLRDFL